MADGNSQAKLLHLDLYRVDSNAAICHARQVHRPEQVDHVYIQQTLAGWNVLEVDQVCHRPQSIASQYGRQELCLKGVG